MNELDRRGFLRLVVAASAAGLPVGCVGGPRRHDLFHAVARSVVGPVGAARIDEGLVDPTAVAEAWLSRLGPLADTLEAALAVLEYGVWPLLPKLRPFTQLSDADQTEVLRSLQQSRFALKRQLFAAAKTVGCLTYYASPGSHPPLGFPGPFGPVAEAMRWTPGD